MEAVTPKHCAQAPAHSLKFTRAAIKQALGAPVEALFEEFEEVPVASGSIGQVYQAKLSAKGARNTGIDPGTALYSHAKRCIADQVEPAAKSLRHSASGRALLRVQA